MSNRRTILSIIAAAFAAAALASACGSAKTAPNGKITALFTTIAKAQDVTNGALAGTGQFTISGAISEKGTVADYRTVKGNTGLIRRVAVGGKGTITFLITIKRFLLREPGEPFKRGAGTSPGRIMKAFRDRPADEVTAAEVSRFLRALDREGLTPRNVNKHREVLAAIFSGSVDDRR